jgi:type I restriction enzyme S subunit
MSELPAGWASATFGEVAEIKLGKMLDKNKNRGIPTPYLRNVNVRWDYVDQSNLLEMPMSPTERASLDIRDGDIMVCEGGEPGRAAVWSYGPNTLSFQKALMRLRPFEKVDSRFLAAHLRRASLSGKLEEHFSGTTIKHLPQQALSRLPVNIPPLSEQRRIVAKIDSLSGKSRRAREHLDHIPWLVEKYKQAVLAAAFSSDDKSTHRLDDLADTSASIRYGVLQPGDVNDVGVPLIRVCDLKDQQVAWSELRRISSDIDNQYASARIRDGDVLISVVGTIGRIALVQGMREPTNIARAVARIRPDFRKVVPRWLAWRLQSADCQRTFAQDAREVARKTLNISLIKDVKLVVPSLQDQARTVARIDRLVTWINRLSAEAMSARKLVDRLDQAVLAKAFRGELVPQDPSDEPASVLLERIKAGKAAGSDAKAKRKKRS